MRGLLALLASYAIKKSQDNLTPIPSHFRTGPDARFVSEAFDNMNMKGTKTTVCCTLAVFQDADDTLTQKPDVNDKKISTRLTETLPCQELTPWFKSKDRTSLPTDMKIISQTDKIELSSQSRKQFIINAGRCAIAENRDEAYYTWAAANALITNRCSPMKKVGFLPVVPRSVTNYSTVYSALQSFEDMKKQLSQQIFRHTRWRCVPSNYGHCSISPIQIPKFISNDGHFPHGKGYFTLRREIFQREWHWYCTYLGKML